MSASTVPQLKFLVPFDERTAYESEARGYFGQAVACLAGLRMIRLEFYDAVRLAQDLAETFDNGDAVFAEPGLVVLPSVTLEGMKRAFEELLEIGYFEDLCASSVPTAGPLHEAELVY